MLHSRPLRSFCLSSVRKQLLFSQRSRPFSSKYDDGKDAKDLDAARKWFSSFNEATIPTSISNTDFSKSSGPGGQKTNKTSSKATTVWPFDYLKSHVPKVLHPGLRSSRYYASSSNAISIQSDVYRSQSENKYDTYQRLNNEIRQIYKSTVPGLTSPEQTQKVEQLTEVARARRRNETENAKRKRDLEIELAKKIRLEKQLGKERAKSRTALQTKDRKN